MERIGSRYVSRHLRLGGVIFAEAMTDPSFYAPLARGAKIEHLTWYAENVVAKVNKCTNSPSARTHRLS